MRVRVWDCCCRCTSRDPPRTALTFLHQSSMVDAFLDLEERAPGLRNSFTNALPSSWRVLAQSRATLSMDHPDWPSTQLSVVCLEDRSFQFSMWDACLCSAFSGFVPNNHRFDQCVLKNLCSPIYAGFQRLVSGCRARVISH